MKRGANVFFECDEHSSYGRVAEVHNRQDALGRAYMAYTVVEDDTGERFHVLPDDGDVILEVES